LQTLKTLFALLSTGAREALWPHVSTITLLSPVSLLAFLSTLTRVPAQASETRKSILSSLSLHRDHSFLDDGLGLWSGRGRGRRSFLDDLLGGRLNKLLKSLIDDILAALDNQVDAIIGLEVKFTNATVTKPDRGTRHAFVLTNDGDNRSLWDHAHRAG